MEKPFLFSALDVPDSHEAEALVGRAGLNLTHVKVGLELFTAEGPKVVHVMRYKGKTILLDLKLHDIPETVGMVLCFIHCLMFLFLVNLQYQ